MALHLGRKTLVGSLVTWLGFLVLLYLHEAIEFNAQALDLSVFLGGKRDQNIPHCPEYPAEFAGYITLAVSKLSPPTRIQ